MGFRYPFLALVNLLAGGFLIAATYGFAASTAVTLGFAISIAVALIGLVMTYASFGTEWQLAILGAFTTLIAGWTIVATNVFADDIARWLVFASGLGHVGLSVLGLVMHEIRTERVVHHLEVTGQREPAATG
jgi:hypothetical protein